MALGWLTLKMEMSLPFILLPLHIFFFSFKRLSPVTLQLPKKGNGHMIKVCQLGGHYCSLRGGSVRPRLLYLGQQHRGPQAHPSSPSTTEGHREPPRARSGARVVSQRKATYHNCFAQLKIFQRISACWVHPEGYGLDVEMTPKLCHLRTPSMDRDLHQISAVSQHRGV